MAVKKPVADPVIRQAFVNGIADFADLGDPGETPAWQIFHVGLQDLAGPAGIGNAKPVAWRFVIGDASGSALSGEIPQSTANRGWVMTALSQGPHIAEALQASLHLETLPDVQSQDFDFRTLSIPGLLIEAFWLKSQAAGGADIVVPYITSSPQLEFGRPYSMDEFLGIVRPMAVKRLTYEDHELGAGS